MNGVYLARDFMEIAIDEARQALDSGDVPVGAIILYKGEIIAKAHNEVEKRNDPLAHAETLAINQAVAILNEKYLINCDIYVTLEPCVMCAGAIILARLRRLYFGADDAKSGACVSLYNIVQDRRLNHSVELYQGIARDNSSKLISDFFKNLRKPRY